MTRLVVVGALVVVLAAATLLVWTGGDVEQARAVDGRILFQVKGCTGCHIGPGVATAVEIGPDLNALAGVAATRREGMSAREYVRESLTRPQAFIVPGYDGPELMPTLELDEEETEALIDFLLGGDTPGA